MSSEPTINRAKTALSRNNFSRPVQHLLESGLLTKKRSFFDYGCGRGDDIAGLAELSFHASGWDPAYRPDAAKAPADIVNLGFVLNVIEDSGERSAALRASWELARGALVVSVISVYERPKDGLSEFEDGHVTQRGTFQRYYEPGEIKEYVDKTLGVDSLPVSPTMVICFRDPELEQEYLAAASTGAASVLPPPSHPLRRSRLNQCIERFQASDPDSWQEIVEAITTYACPPPSGMIAAHQELTRCGVGTSDALAAVAEMLGDDVWERTATRVRNRFISRLALGFFRGQPKPKHYRLLEREAITHHFGSFRNALGVAKATLFSIGNPDTIEAECGACPLGVEDEQALYVHRSCLPDMSPVLQTYVGVGSLFYGAITDVDVFKLHKRSGKLTLLLYDDYETVDEPVLRTRVKVDFRGRRIDFFDHSREAQRLTNKTALSSQRLKS